MIIVTTGGRNLFLTLEGALYFHQKLKELGATEVVHGGARGVDSCVDFLCHLWNVKKVIFKPDYETFEGSYAPLERNIKMADYAQVGIAFRGGTGTAHMTQQMTERGKRMISLVDARFTTDDYTKGIYMNQDAIKELKGLSL